MAGPESPDELSGPGESAGSTASTPMTATSTSPRAGQLSPDADRLRQLAAELDAEGRHDLADTVWRAAMALKAQPPPVRRVHAPPDNT